MLWIPIIILYFLGRRWLRVRGGKLGELRAGRSSFVTWLQCMWGWTWRSFFIFVIPLGIFASALGGNDPEKIARGIDWVLVGWVLTLFLSLDSPVWPLRKYRRGAPSTVPNEIYDRIAEEFRTGTYDQGLWYRAIAETGGDQNKAIAAYTSNRAAFLAGLVERRNEHQPTPFSFPIALFATAIVLSGIVAWLVDMRGSQTLLTNRKSQQSDSIIASIRPDGQRASAGPTANPHPATNAVTWNLPFKLGETIESVRKIFGPPLPGQITNADTWEELSKTASAYEAAMDEDEAEKWRRNTPNLQWEDYLRYNLFLKYSSGRLYVISLNNQGRNSQTTPYSGPIINGLDLTDQREDVFRKLGPPNNPTLIGVPVGVAQLEHSYPGLVSAYCWDFGDIFVFVEIRDKEEQVETNLTLPENTISNVTIIEHLPIEQYPPL